jgi:hypothetical protein
MKNRWLRPWFAPAAATASRSFTLDSCATWHAWQFPKNDWCAAVESADGIRLTTGDAVARNPVTGEEIRIRRSEGDAEAYFTEDSTKF